jgi:hypothetical protein
MPNERLNKNGVVMQTHIKTEQPAKRLTWSIYGNKFVLPHLDETLGGIVCSDYLYVYNDDGEIEVGYVEEVFDFDKSFKHVGSKAGADVRVIRATYDNLVRFAQLPMIDEEVAADAINLALTWRYVIPSVSLMAVMMKNATILIDETPRDQGGRPHRLPGLDRNVTRNRKPTHDEIVAMTYGSKVDLSETVVLREVYDDAARLGRHLKGQHQPYSQQMIGAWAIVNAKRFALWYDMRVGKTITVMLAAKELMEVGEIDQVLIVCPVTNMYDPWMPELISQGFEVRVLDGTAEEDEWALAESLNVGYATRPTAYVINFERVGLRIDLIDEYLDLQRTLIAADETSAIKNPNSERAAATHDLCARSVYCTMLNGTPIEQGPQDIWSQMRCLDTWGVEWHRDFGGFNKEWLTPVARGKLAVQQDKVIQFEIMISQYGLRYIRSEADQFHGKDKQFRHIDLAPTHQMVQQMKQIREGFLTMTDSDGNMVEEQMTSCILRTYGFMREGASGYGKFRPEGSDAYIRVRHDIDPKILWVKCLIESQPGTPFIIYVEFNEQEQRLKEMLNSINVKWTSTRPEMRLVKDSVLASVVPMALWLDIKARFIELDEVQSVFYFPNSGEVNVPAEVRYNQDVVWYVSTITDTVIVNDEVERINRKIESCKRLADPLRNDNEFERENAEAVLESLMVGRNEIIKSLAGLGRLRQRWGEYIDTVDRYIDMGPLPPSQRSAQISDFNEGESNVFICKWSQARGIRLNRQEAVNAGIGEWPTIVSMAPPWSLGHWLQGNERANAIDKRTGSNVCTMIYSMSIKGSIEQKIIAALRKKQSVQESLLKDVEREGHLSFIDQMITDMEDAAASGSIFDHDEVNARIVCGVPPFSKLTVSRIDAGISAKYDINKKDAKKFVSDSNDAGLTAAYNLLIERAQ